MTDGERRDRQRRRQALLRELAEAKDLRARVAPRRSHRAKVARMYLMLTYRQV